MVSMTTFPASGSQSIRLVQANPMYVETEQFLDLADEFG